MSFSGKAQHTQFTNYTHEVLFLIHLLSVCVCSCGSQRNHYSFAFVLTFTHAHTPVIIHLAYGWRTCWGANKNKSGGGSERDRVVTTQHTASLAQSWKEDYKYWMWTLNRKEYTFIEQAGSRLTKMRRGRLRRRHEKSNNTHEFARLRKSTWHKNIRRFCRWFLRVLALCANTATCLVILIFNANIAINWIFDF